jgi:hypothetical protein
VVFEYFPVKLRIFIDICKYFYYLYISMYILYADLCPHTEESRTVYIYPICPVVNYTNSLLMLPTTKSPDVIENEICTLAMGLMANESERDFAVSSSLHMRTSLGLVYTGFCVGKISYTNIINLNGDEWATLIVILSNINDSLSGGKHHATRPPAIPHKRFNSA